MRPKDVHLKHRIARIIVSICHWIYLQTDIKLAPWRIYQASVAKKYNKLLKQAK